MLKTSAHPLGPSVTSWAARKTRGCCCHEESSPGSLCRELPCEMCLERKHHIHIHPGAGCVFTLFPKWQWNCSHLSPPKVAGGPWREDAPCPVLVLAGKLPGGRGDYVKPLHLPGALCLNDHPCVLIVLKIVIYSFRFVNTYIIIYLPCFPFFLHDTCIMRLLLQLRVLRLLMAITDQLHMERKSDGASVWL